MHRSSKPVPPVPIYKSNKGEVRAQTSRLDLQVLHNIGTDILVRLHTSIPVLDPVLTGILVPVSTIYSVPVPVRQPTSLDLVPADTGTTSS